MWTIDKVIGFDFMSHKEIDFNIPNNQLTAIYGINKDLESKRSNGSGKSVLIDLISFLLMGETLRKLKTIKELINNDSDFTKGSIYLSNKVTNQTLQIDRELSRKSSQKIRIYVDEELQDQLKDLHPNESNKFIEEIIGISFDDIINYYLISKFKYQSLFLAPDSVKKEVINRFSKADKIDIVFDQFDKDIKLEEKNLNDQQRKVDVFVTNISSAEQQIEELQDEDSEENKKLALDELNGKIVSYKKNIETKTEQIEEHINTLEIIKNKLVELEDSLKSVISDEELLNVEKVPLSENLNKKREEYTNIKNKYSSQVNKIDKNDKDIKLNITEKEDSIVEIHQFIIETENFLAGEIECPSCHYKFILANKEFNVEEAKKILPDFKRDKEELVKEIDALNLNLKENKKERESIDALIKNDQIEVEKQANEIKGSIKKIDDELILLNNSKLKFNVDINKEKKNISILENEIHVFNSDIKMFETKIKSFEDQIKDINESDETEKSILRIKEKIKNFQESKLKEEENLIIINDKISKLNEWNLKFKRFKSFLANQSISQIKDQTNFYLHKMKSDLIVSIDAFRELSSKKVKEEINVELSRDGIENESFGKFSGGEKSIADLACILSLQKIINLTSPSGGLSFLAIDEILESVDEFGISNIFKCLNNLDQTILVITHSKPNEVIDCNRVVVEKENRTSKIVIN